MSLYKKFLGSKAVLRCSLANTHFQSLPMCVIGELVDSLNTHPINILHIHQVDSLVLVLDYIFNYDHDEEAFLEFP
jgi:hypothetical protein